MTFSFGFSNCKTALPTTFSTTERGVVQVKGKGDMTTHWLETKMGRSAPTKDEVI